MNLGRMLSKLQSTGFDIHGECAIAVGVARDLKITYFPNASDPLFIRIVERRNGQADFADLIHLKKHLLNHVSAPISVLETEDLVCGIFEFLDHKKAALRRLPEDRLLTQVSEILIGMHCAGRGYQSGKSPISIDNVITFLEGRNALPENFERYLRGPFRAIPAHSQDVSQHCDFSYANLGLRSEGSLVVFDWEDYGLVRTAGFDFATFLLSHLHTDDRFPTLTSPFLFEQYVTQHFDADFLESLGFSKSAFTLAFPGYVSFFLTLKADYGSRINDRLRNVWNAITSSTEWRRVLEIGSG
jgi:hypothetical protein